VASKGEVLFQETLVQKLGVEEHFQDVVCIVVKVNDSFSVPSRVLADSVKPFFPVFYQLDHKAVQLSQMRNILENLL
jgi:hypothetical protein